MNLKDKVIVITGGTRGLGKCLAEIFVDKGATVIVTHLTDSFKPFKDEHNPSVFSVDVRHKEEMQTLLDTVVTTHKKIDIWINNAGIWMPESLIEDMDMEKVHNLFETNVFGLMYGSQVALVKMKEQKSGIIVNIISTAALGPRPKHAGYSASKFAADGFTKALREELREDGVAVVAVYPGGMKTELFHQGPPDDFNEFMNPREVAEKIVANLEQEDPEVEQIIKRQA